MYATNRNKAVYDDRRANKRLVALDVTVIAIARSSSCSGVKLTSGAVILDAHSLLCLSHLGPCHQSSLCNNSLGDIPLDIISAGLSLPDTWNHCVRSVICWISETLFTANGFHRDGLAAIQYNTIVESTQNTPFVSCFKLALTFCHRWHSNKAPESSSIGRVTLFCLLPFSIGSTLDLAYSSCTVMVPFAEIVRIYKQAPFLMHR